MKFRRSIIISTSIIVCTSVIGGVIYNKKVQAVQLHDKFKLDMQHKEFKDAKKMYDTANNDAIISNLFNFNNAAEKVVSANFNALKNDYINEKISYKQYNDYMNSIKVFTHISKKDIKKSIDETKKIELVRQAFIGAEKLYSDKKYSETVQALNNIPDVDKKTTNKIVKLKDDAKKAYVSEINAQVDSLTNSESYDGALKLLNEQKNIYDQFDFNNKVANINNLITKKAEEERKKKEEEEKKKKEEEIRRRQEEQKKQEAITNSILSGYTANPSIENQVTDQVSATNYLIFVNLENQTSNIFYGQKGSWKLVRNFTMSSGEAGSETPRGTFTVKERGQWFFSERYGEGAKYWTRFYGEYLFHSLPMNRNMNVVDPTLGTPASHGCVRLDIANAKWIYDNIPSGTKVVIN